MADLLVNLRDHLIAQGIVREPRTAGSNPPLWLEPRLGVPAPGEGQGSTEIGADAVLGAWVTNGVPPAPFNAGRRTDIVDLRFRTRTASIVTPIEEAIRAALLDKRNWLMSTMTIIESLIYRELQPLGSDEQSFDWVQSYSFERYSGLP